MRSPPGPPGGVSPFPMFGFDQKCSCELLQTSLAHSNYEFLKILMIGDSHTDVDERMFDDNRFFVEYSKLYSTISYQMTQPCFLAKRILIQWETIDICCFCILIFVNISERLLNFSHPRTAFSDFTISSLASSLEEQYTFLIPIDFLIISLSCQRTYVL